MAQSSITSEFNGVVFQDLFMSLVNRMDAVNKGLLGLHTGFNEDLHLPQFSISGTSVGKTNDITQAYNPARDPATDSSGQAVYNEKTKIQLEDREIFIPNVQPNAWRSVWQEYAPNIDELMLELQVNPTIQQAFFERIVELNSNVTAFQVWQGDTATTGATYSNYDGIFKQLADLGSGSGGYIDVTPSGASAITSSTVLDAFDEVEEFMVSDRQALYNHPDGKYIVSHKTLKAYRDAEIAISGKGATAGNTTYFDLPAEGDMKYKGKRVFASEGFPDDVIMFTRTNPSPISSTLHLGFRNQADMDYVKFGRQHEYQEVYFFLMAYSIGTAVTTPEDIVIYDSRS